MLRKLIADLLPLPLILLAASTTFAQGAAFSYQGRLTLSGSPANGTYDMQFKLFDTPDVDTGTQQGQTVTNSTVQVASGFFSVLLDFGAGVFDGTPRYLEVGVRATDSKDPYTILAPRQPLTPTPEAVRSMTATAADGLSAACVNCITSSQIASVEGAQITGTIPVESVPTGSGNYIQNAVGAFARGKNAPQPAASFNIDGDGVIGGSLGVGADVRPGWKLNVNGASVLTPGGTGGEVQFSTPNGETGLAIVGTNRADIRFDGTSLKLVAGPGSGTPGSERGMHVDLFGHVGIGTTHADAQLEVHNSGPTSAINLSTGSGIEGPSSYRLQADSGLGGQGKSFVILDNVASRYRMVINGAGFVGFGTTTPLTPLEISSVSPVITLRDVQPAIGLNAPAFIQNAGGSLVFKSTGIAPSDAAMVIRTGDGLVSVKVLQILGGADLSESFDVRAPENSSSSASDIQPGMVVAIDAKDTGKLIVSSRAYDRRVAGIISGAGGVKPGLMMGQQGSVADGKYPVALTGRVWVYCDATRRAIKPGDLLTSSATRGHAMKVLDHAKAQGAIIGKAMTALKSGRGLVLVLVSLQ